MRVAAMECRVCRTEVRGAFRQTMFDLLTAEEQTLLEQYLLVDFSIKDLAAQTGMGYAAIRTRLDILIAHYRALHTNEQQKKRILEMVAERRISAAEGAQMIAELEQRLG